MEIAIAVGTAVAASLWAAWAWGRPRAVRRRADAFAELLQLLAIAPNAKNPGEAEGLVGGRRVRLRRAAPTDGADGTSLGRIAVDLDLSENKISIVDDWSAMAGAQSLPGPHVSLPHAAGARLFVTGSEAAAVAALAPDVRDFLRAAAVAQRFRVSGRELVIEVVERSSKAADLERLVCGAAEAAARIEAELRDVPASLARAAAHDPIPDVRRRALELLLQIKGAEPAARAAAEAALRDADDAVALTAARALDADGAAGLRRGALARDLPAEARVNALRDYAARADAPDLESALRALLADEPSPAVRIAALELAAEHRCASLADAVAAIARSGGESTAASAARALGEVGANVLELTWLELLDRPFESVQFEAARRLASCGGALSVEPLMNAARGALPGTRMRRAAEQSLAAIRARLDASAAGGLSPAEPAPDAGRISLASDSGGGLSTAAEQEK